MNWDYVSDIHLDFWVKYNSNPQKMKKKIIEFTEKIIPKNHSNTLIIAGDIGHNNLQNFMMFTHLKEFYKTIFYVFGNHDYYLESNNMKKRYKKSENRVIEMENMLQELENVYRLDGKSYEIDNHFFGGCDMWYDFEYGKMILNETEKMTYEHWWNTSNDREFHVGMPCPTEKAATEKKKASLIECDIFVSHVPPIGVPMGNYLEEKDLPFYTFNGENLFLKSKPKVWVSGHIHREMDMVLNGIHMLSNPIGYPPEKMRNPIPKKIKTYSMK